MTDAEVSTRKKRICTGHKASATRTLGQLAVALGETPPNPDRLSLLKQTLEQKLETLKGLDTKIIELIPQRKPLMMKFNKPTSIGSEYMKP